MQMRSQVRSTTRFLSRTVWVAVAGAALAKSAYAQAANYPSLQVPQVSTRDYTAAISTGSGTIALFQWREGVSARTHVGLDAGFVDYRGSDNLTVFIGGAFGHSLTRATRDQPLEVLLTAGLGVGIGGGTTLFRAPVGASVGHRFDLDGGMSITPYAHPRLSIDVCDDCGRSGDSRSEASIGLELGASFQVTPRLGVRVAAVFSGSDFFGDDSFAIGLNFTPALLSARR